MKHFCVKKFAIKVLVLIILLLPIASMSDSYYFDKSTGTEFLLPAGWDEFDRDDDVFSHNFRDNLGASYNYSELRFGTERIVKVFPYQYIEAAKKNNMSALLLNVMTTSYPTKLYADEFDTTEEYISPVTLGGVQYMRIDAYKADTPREHKSSDGVSYYFDTVWYVCIIENTIYVYCFNRRTRTTSEFSMTDFEDIYISQYERIMENCKYASIEHRMKTFRTIGICASIIVLLVILRGICYMVEKKRQKVKKINRLSENNAVRDADEKHASNTIKPYQPTQSISNTYQEPKTATVATDQHAEMKSPIASSENEGIQYCRKCGNRLLPDSVFCDKCGTKVQ